MSIEEDQTWRELLGKVISDSHERQKIAELLGVNPITLIRWATGKSSPRQENLRPLIEALPQYRQRLSDLIKKEFPQLANDNSSAGDTLQEIPSAFYARVVNAYVTTPPSLRSWSVSISILQQILGHLDPQQRGMLVIVTQCVPPSPGKKVRSLRLTMGRGTHPWPSHMENQTLFLGAESQTGNALMAGHFVVIATLQDKARLFPTHNAKYDESSVALPILISDRAAGCLYVCTTQPNYFTQEHLDLLQRYADLLVLAFEPDEFYELSKIELGFMPSCEAQLQVLVKFQQLVLQQMIDIARENQVISRLEAETLVWQGIEEELLHLALKPENL